MFDYTGQVVAVTGASSGLGNQMARAYAAQGATVVIMARRLERLEELKSEIEAAGGKAHSIQLDVTNDENIEESIREIIEKFGKVDVLVNNAGGSKAGSVTEMTNEAWDFTIDLDLTSIFKMTRAYATRMKEAGYGRIINIASMYGLMGTNQNAGAYHASKAGVVNYSRAASAELSEFGITVNTICPGYFETELTEDSIGSDEFQGYINLTVPAKRQGQTGELNAAAIFLGSKEASYVTGVALPVDGGWSSAK